MLRVIAKVGEGDDTWVRGDDTWVRGVEGYS